MLRHPQGTELREREHHAKKRRPRLEVDGDMITLCNSGTRSMHGPGIDEFREPAVTDAASLRRNDGRSFGVVANGGFDDLE